MPLRIEVDAIALGRVLRALVGHDHEIRELQATRGIHELVPNPIVTLLEEYAAWTKTQPKSES